MDVSSIMLEPIPVDTSADRSAAGVSGKTSDSLRREIRVLQLRDRHRTMLWLALAIVAAAFLLQVRGTTTVGLAWANLDVPVLCGSRAWFGVNCPGCGLTRSFVALASGDLSQSLGFHRLGWLLALAVVAQIPYRVFALRELRSRVVERTWPAWFGYFLIAMLIGNWLLATAGF